MHIEDYQEKQEFVKTSSNSQHAKSVPTCDELLNHQLAEMSHRLTSRIQAFTLLFWGISLHVNMSSLVKLTE